MARTRPGPIQRAFRPEAREITKVYADARARIVSALKRGGLDPLDRRIRASKIGEIDRIMEDATKRGTRLAREKIPEAYDLGVSSVRDEVRDAHLQARARFGGIHKDQADLLTGNLVGKLEDLRLVVGRQVDDLFRNAALEVLSRTALGVGAKKISPRQALANEIRDRGIDSFIDQARRAWDLDAYAEMVVRTTTREAITISQAIETVGEGFDLVEILGTSVWPNSPCIPFEGTELSITGAVEGYVTVEEAMSEGLFHPNCIHDMVPIIAPRSRIESGDVSDSDAREIARILARGNRRR